MNSVIFPCAQQLSGSSNCVFFFPLLPEITIDHVAGQIFLFFIAGSHPLSIVVSTTLLELAANKRIQKKLHDEIDESMTQNTDGEINYDILKNMSYLDKVIRGKDAKKSN